MYITFKDSITNKTHKVKNLIKSRFTKLIVLEFIKRYNNHTYWLCKCDCGDITQATSSALRNKIKKSCGCLGIENRIKHNMYGTKFYKSWSYMKSRCSNPNNISYPHYGGRGITFCSEWNEFNNFYKDMYESYLEGLSLERIDVTKGYSKENCTWIDKRSQAKNKRNTNRVIFNDELITLSDLSSLTGIPRGILRERILIKNIPTEKAILIPYKKKEPAKLYNYLNEYKTIPQLAKEHGIDKGTLNSRINKYNMSVEEAINFRKSKA